MIRLKNNQSLYTCLVYIGLLGILVLTSCNNAASVKDNANSFAVSSINNQWNDYWYAGKAEVNSYQLIQSRYGQDRQGTGVMIFVTEDFSESKHVKLDNPNDTPDDKVSVLKSNLIRKFNTGIYDYSMMASVFTPISLDRYPNTLKVTTSSQEWCGHTWSQYDWNGKGFEFQGRSYFESEGDENETLNVELLEDEIWNRLRINPASIPDGEIDIIPGSFYSRLDHIPFAKEKATLTKKITTNAIELILDYKSRDRNLVISMEPSFPYKIVGWKETTARGTTTGKLIKTMHIPYWNMNGNQYEVYRDSLGI